MIHHNIINNKAILSACLLAAGGALVFNTFPQILGAIAAQFLLDEVQVASLISAYMGGFALIALVAPLWMPRVPWKQTAFIGYVILGIGTVMLNYVSKDEIELAMLLMGIGASIIFTISLGILSAAEDPDRGFGFKLTAEMVLGAILIFVIANIVAGQFGYSGFVFGTLSLYLITGVALFWLPKNFLKTLEKDNEKEKNFGSINVSAIIATAALVFFFGAYTGVWGFVSFVGIELGITDEQVNTVLTFALLSGIVGALLCAWIGHKYGQALPLLGGMAIMSLSILLLIYGGNFITFAISVCIINALLQFVLAYQMGLIALVDHSGKYVVMLAFILAFSAAISGELMGAFIESNGLSTAMLGSVGAVIVSMILTVIVLKKGSNYKAQEPLDSTESLAAESIAAN